MTSNFARPCTRSARLWLADDVFPADSIWRIIRLQFLIRLHCDWLMVCLGICHRHNNSVDLAHRTFSRLVRSSPGDMVLASARHICFVPKYCVIGVGTNGRFLLLVWPSGRVVGWPPSSFFFGLAPCGASTLFNPDAVGPGRNGGAGQGMSIRSPLTRGVPTC